MSINLIRPLKKFYGFSQEFFEKVQGRELNKNSVNS